MTTETVIKNSLNSKSKKMIYFRLIETKLILVLENINTKNTWYKILARKSKSILTMFH